MKIEVIRIVGQHVSIIDLFCTYSLATYEFPREHGRMAFGCRGTNQNLRTGVSGISQGSPPCHNLFSYLKVSFIQHNFPVLYMIVFIYKC